MEQVDTQVSRLFHQAEFVLVLNKAKTADQGLGQGLEESPAASGFAIKGQIGNRGRFRVEGTVFGSARGQPSARRFASGLGDHHPGGAGFLVRLSGVSAIGKHGGPIRGHGKKGIGSGKAAEIAHIRQMGDQQAVDSLVLHPAPQAAQSGSVIHLLRYTRCLPQLTQASTLRVHRKVVTPMLVVMKPQATPEEIQAVCEQIQVLGFRAHPMPGAQRTAIGITGNSGAVDQGDLEELSGVAEVIRVTKPYKLVSRDVKEEDTVISFPGTDATIGGPGLAVIGGPCSIESREQAFAVAEQIARAGAQFFRGGAYKPRTSPYAFQGMGEDGLKIMAEIREKFGLRIVTEALDNESLDLVAEYADVIQIGARNMQNFSLLKRAGRTRKPVMVKRGLSATLDELLMAAEYVMSEGNYQVILCERGVRTFADHTRNTLDLSIVPAVQRLSHLPIIVDPSHGTGKRNMVLPLARAAVAVGADGLMIEVHHQPDKALSDGAQSMYPDQFVELMDEISQIAAAIHRSVPRGITVAEPAPAGRL